MTNMASIPFFNTIQDFREHAPGVESSITVDELNSSAMAAKRTIVGLVGLPIWEALVAMIPGTDAVLNEARTCARSAMANLTMYKYKAFEVVKKRTSDKKDVYRYELDGMRREYLDGYYSSIDALIGIFEQSDAPAIFAPWKTSVQFKLREKLLVKTAEEFQCYYGIDCSWLFFARTIPIQRELVMNRLAGYIRKIESRPELEEPVKLTLCLMVVALAIQRFDMLELPATIRNHSGDTLTSRSDDSEYSSLSSLAGQLMQQASDNLATIDTLLSTPDVDLNIADLSDLNSEEDKVFLI
jgi:hypothetical protein